MKATTRAKLQAAGWTVGDATDFLHPSPAEAAYVELKLSLSLLLRRWRSTRKLTQTELAKRLGSSQSRVAKMEAGDPTVSADLLLRSLLALGATRKDIASSLTTPRRKAGTALYLSTRQRK
jgi:DNA-binding XRE family transcriptional regulator